MSRVYLDVGAGNPCAAQASAIESPFNPLYLLSPSPVPFGAVRPDGSEIKTTQVPLPFEITQSVCEARVRYRPLSIIQVSSSDFFILLLTIINNDKIFTRTLNYSP